MFKRLWSKYGRNFVGWTGMACLFAGPFVPWVLGLEPGVWVKLGVFASIVTGWYCLGKYQIG